MKGVIIILMFPERGALNASFQLSKQLQNRGHKLLYLSTLSYASHIKKQGFDFYEFDLNTFYDKLLSEQQKIKDSKENILRKIRRWIQLIGQRNDQLEKYLTEQFSWLDDMKIDLLLIDPILFNCSLPFIKRSIPIIHLNTTFAYLFNKTSEPVFSSRIPYLKPRILDRTIGLVTWGYYYYRAIQKDLKWHWQHGLKPTRTINTIKAKIKAAGGKYGWGEYGYRLKTEELVLASEHLDFAKKSSQDNRVYAGSSVLEERLDFETTELNIPDDKKVLYCSLGSYSHLWLKEKSIKVYNTIINVMKDQEGWEVVIQVGDIEYYNKASLPKNIHIVNYVNQIDFLRKANMAVTHAGCSSYKECTYAGTPMIVIPWNNDGFGNSARVVYHQLGLRLNIENITEKVFKKTFEKILASAEIKYATERLRKLLLNENDCQAGTEFIENALKK